MNAVTQEDIGMFQDMFSKLSNILVKASDLGAKIPELESQLSALSAESESVRKRNMELDEQLATVRGQRDEAQTAVNQLKVDYSEKQQDYLAMTNDLIFYKSTVDADAIVINDLKKERDDYGMKNLDLADKLDAANAVIAKFKELLGSLSGPATPEPVHVPSLDTLQPATITPVGEMVLETPPVPITKRYYRWAGSADEQAKYDYEAYQNNRTRHWDSDVNDYYVEVAA
jgi:hypothetical protein